MTGCTVHPPAPLLARRAAVACLVLLALFALTAPITASGSGPVLGNLASGRSTPGMRLFSPVSGWLPTNRPPAGLPPVPSAIEQQGHRFRFDHLTPDAGLSQSVVTSILQDNQGFLWFATQDGLNRYDGYEFKIFKADPGNLDGLNDNTLYSIARDAAGSIWIGTNAGGLNRYDPQTGRFAHYVSNPADPRSISQNSVSFAYVGRDGLVWAGTSGAGLNVLDPATGQFRRFEHDPADPTSMADGTVTAIAEDGDGTIWVATAIDGLSRLDRRAGTFTHYRNDPDDAESLGSNNLQPLYFDREGTLWVGTTDAGLNRFVRQTGKFVRYLPDPSDPARLGHPWVYAILEDSRDNLWVGTHGGGLASLDRQTGRFTRYQHDPADAESLANDSIWSVFEDQSGVLWFGTFGSGVDHYDPHKNKFLLLKPAAGGQHDSLGDQVWAIYQDSRGDLWLGSSTRGLSRLDLTTGEWQRYRADPADPRALSGDAVYALYEDRAGQLWVGTDKQLGRFDRQTESFSSYNTPPVQLSIYEDRSGRLWVGTAGGLLLLDRGSGAIHKYQHDANDPTSLSSDFVSAIREDVAGTLWVGTLNGGLNRFDPASGKATRYAHVLADPQTISDNGILAIHAARDGTLWLGTTGGLNRFDPGTGKAKSYHEKDGLPNDFVYGILEDEQGMLWLSTNRGIARFDPRSKQVKVYRKSDGLQGNEFNQGAYFENADGLMYFGGVEGLNAFYPGQVEDNRFVPPVVITGFQIRHAPVAVGPDSPLAQPIEASRQITLAYSQGFFSFSYSALHYSAPEENQYAYMMEGLDKDWNYVGNRRYAEYTNVPPGSYTFRVKGSNRDGVWNEEGAALRIVIPPPFWQTTWFRLLLAAAALGLVYGGVGLRFRAVERQRQRLERLVEERTRQLQETLLQLERSRDAAEAANRAKSTFLANMSHEFRTPLNAILGFTQVLVRDEQLQDDQRENLEIIQRSSEHLLGLINDVLDMSKIEAGRTVLNERGFDLHRMLEGLEEMFALRADRKGLALTMELAPDMPRYLRGDEGKLRQVLMNLLGNAVKFTQDGRVILRAWPCSASGDPRAKGNWLHFEVEDTGPGIAPEELEQLFLPFVQTRSGQEAQEGTGLGLPISQQYVRLMGGEITVQSEPARGSVFGFELPLETIGPGEMETAPPSRRVAGLEPGQPAYRLLAVDDREINRKLLLKLLQPIGFEVREAANGEEALAIWDQWQPHLICMDMRMPVMDGYEATRRIKATTRGQATIIIALTASALEEDRAVILSEGCDDYLRKPFREEDLFAAIARHLGVRYVYEELAPAAEVAEKAIQAGEGTTSDTEADRLQDLARRLAGADPAWVVALENATILGDLDAIVELAGAVSSSEPVLAEGITHLASRFEHDTILSLVQQRSSEQNATTADPR